MYNLQVACEVDRIWDVISKAFQLLGAFTLEAWWLISSIFLFLVAVAVLCVSELR